MKRHLTSLFVAVLNLLLAGQVCAQEATAKQLVEAFFKKHARLVQNEEGLLFKVVEDDSQEFTGEKDKEEEFRQLAKGLREALPNGTANAIEVKLKKTIRKQKDSEEEFTIRFIVGKRGQDDVPDAEVQGKAQRGGGSAWTHDKGESNIIALSVAGNGGNGTGALWGGEGGIALVTLKKGSTQCVAIAISGDAGSASRGVGGTGGFTEASVPVNCYGFAIGGHGGDSNGGAFQGGGGGSATVHVQGNSDGEAYDGKGGRGGDAAEPSAQGGQGGTLADAQE